MSNTETQESTESPESRQLNRTLARAMFVADFKKGEDGADNEALKTAWGENRTEYIKNARQLRRRMAALGLSVVSENKAELSDED